MTTGAEGKKRSRVVSGMRPTGRLHIGHYFGALENWVRLQNAIAPGGEGQNSEKAGHGNAVPLRESRPEYECFYFIADWHALTSDYADTSGVAQNTIEIMTDYLAAGLDPAKSVIFQQSLVPEHAELHLLLSMVTPLSWLERVPTYKEALENVKDKDLHNYGFLGYPVLQCADIVIYTDPAAELLVPVGEDQASHVELSREIVGRFTYFYNRNALSIAPGLLENPDLLEKLVARITHIEQERKRILLTIASGDPSQLLGYLRRLTENETGWDDLCARIPESTRFLSYAPILRTPHEKLTPTPRIPGLDGRKMSKSYGNAITLSESNSEIRAKTKVMKTDPQRQRRSDKGNPDVCPVYDWHKLFSPPSTLEWAATGCRTAGIGCIECKAKMADHLIEWLDREGIRERRLHYEQRKNEVKDMIREGSVEARLVAQRTMSRVRDAVFGKERIRRRTIRQHPSGK